MTKTLKTMTEKEFRICEYGIRKQNPNWDSLTNEKKAEILAIAGYSYPGLGIETAAKANPFAKAPGLHKKVFKGTPDEIDSLYFPWLKLMKKNNPGYREISKKEDVDTHSILSFGHILTVIYCV